MRRWTPLAVLAMLTAIALPVTARLGFPEPATERAELIEGIYFQIMAVGIFVFLLVFALLAYVLWRFRENGGAGRATFERERDNLKAEMVWTIIPLIIVMWVGVISYQALVELDDIDESAPDPHTVIDIEATRYTWTAKYDTGVVMNAVGQPDLNLIDEFVVPADEPLLFRVTGMDVIHSFNVVALGQTLDAVPGQVNELLVRGGLPARDEPYFTQCKEDCLTPGHSYMHAKIRAVPASEYDAWTQERIEIQNALPQHVISLEYVDGGFEAPQSLKLGVGTEVTLQIINNDTAEHTFTFGGSSVAIPGQSIDVIKAEIAAAGPRPLEADDGASVAFTAVAPQRIDVSLQDFSIAPADLEIEAGEVYLVRVVNRGPAAHNLYIGPQGGDGVSDALWRTETFPVGEKMLLLTPTDAGPLDMWCQVPSHYNLGMQGTVTVT